MNDTTKPLGRPRTHKGGKSVPVYLSTANVETAKTLGDGNVSAGVRLALDTVAAQAVDLDPQRMATALEPHITCDDPLCLVHGEIAKRLASKPTTGKE